MHTIVLATQKGGSGKSTLSIGLALAAIADGHTVRLIETDPQGTLSNWQSRRPYAEPIVEPIYCASELEPLLQLQHQAGVTLTIIDTAAGTSAITTTAIGCADLCLIPSRPSVADIEATATTLGTIRAFDRPFAFVLNQTPIRGQRINSAAHALAGDDVLDLTGIVAQPFIVMRNDHQDALGAGLAVTEFAPNGKSAEEIRGLWQWVASKLDIAVTTDLASIDVSPDTVPDHVPTLWSPALAELDIVAVS